MRQYARKPGGRKCRNGGILGEAEAFGLVKPDCRRRPDLPDRKKYREALGKRRFSRRAGSRGSTAGKDACRYSGQLPGHPPSSILQPRRFYCRRHQLVMRLGCSGSSGAWLWRTSSMLRAAVRAMMSSS